MKCGRGAVGGGGEEGEREGGIYEAMSASFV